MEELTLASTVGLVVALALALAFEFVNGFHDTANAVATVIYTHTLTPRAAVMWSGLWNLIGVLVSSGAVAFSVLALLPAQLLLDVGSAAGFAMVFALLTSSILWNVGTWYLGLPASSSHTLIGSMLGVGVANSLLRGGAWTAGVNWEKARDVMLSLLLSPGVGFLLSLLLLLVVKKLVNRPELFGDPKAETGPPTWIRSILFITCTGVSFAHGSNDGQKGMGLILVILIGILPGQYAVNLALAPGDVLELSRAAEAAASIPGSGPGAPVTTSAAAVAKLTHGVGSLRSISPEARNELRKHSYFVAEAVKQWQGQPTEGFRAADRLRRALERATLHIPLWVKISVALALSLGTMIGWQRIVITVGEKIGKTHLSYAQGAVAEMSAMTTIFAGDMLGLPLSTTHVLSSGIAGTMVANRSGLQTRTVRQVLLAWVLTLPVCVFLGALLFALGFNMLLALGLHR